MPIAVDSERGFFRAAHRRLAESLSAQQLDEFATLASDQERFQWLWDVRAAHEPPFSFSAIGKDLEQAKQFKSDGNMAFKKEDYRTAVRLYSKSILLLPVDSEELSVVHANRSAALSHLEEHQLALQDIRIALDLGYPKHMQYKLYDRQARCLLAQKQHLAARDAFKKTLAALDDSPLPLGRRRKWQMDVQIMISMFDKLKDIHDEPLTAAALRQVKEPLPAAHLLLGPHRQQRANGHGGLVSAALRFHDGDPQREEGRHVTADHDVKAGDLLLSEQPAVAVLLQERVHTHCFQCFRRLRAPVACPRCSAVLYCGASCRELAERTHHAVECSVLPLLWGSGASITCLMALRVISQMPKGRAPGESIMTLVTHTQRRQPEDLLHRTHMAVFLARCLQVSAHAGEGEALMVTGGRLLTLLQLLQFNVHEVSELELKAPRRYDTASSNFVGAALYPTLALFNHSCDPGVVRYFCGTTVVVHAAKGIRAGEPVSENYGFCYTNKPRAERQQSLRQQYWFSCHCQPCEEDWPQLRDMERDQANVMRFRCDPGGSTSSPCSNVIVVPTDTNNFMVQCRVCKQHTNILKGLKALQDTDSMLKIAQSILSEGNLPDALDRYLKILNLLEETLMPPFKDFALCQDNIRMCLVALGEDVVVSGVH